MFVEDATVCRCAMVLVCSTAARAPMCGRGATVPRGSLSLCCVRTGKQGIRMHYTETKEGAPLAGEARGLVWPQPASPNAWPVTSFYRWTGAVCEI